METKTQRGCTIQNKVISYTYEYVLIYSLKFHKGYSEELSQVLKDS